MAHFASSVPEGFTTDRVVPTIAAAGGSEEDDGKEGETANSVEKDGVGNRGKSEGGKDRTTGCLRVRGRRPPMDEDT